MTHLDGAGTRHFIRASLLAAVLLIQGCAAFTEQVAEFQRGWREMRVTKVVLGTEKVRADASDCRKQAAPPVASGSYVLMNYQVGRRLNWFVAPVPRGTEVSPGQTYLVNVKDCGAPWRNVSR